MNANIRKISGSSKYLENKDVLNATALPFKGAIGSALVRCR